MSNVNDGGDVLWKAGSGRVWFGMEMGAPAGARLPLHMLISTIVS